jgi:uncharacterized protein
MIHGLCGSHKSAYLIRMARRLRKQGIRSVRINLRGCGSGKGLARKTYHCGQSDDILQVLISLKKEAPLSPIILLGFSLSGNIVMKLAGELQSDAKKYLQGVMAINPPIDVHACISLMGQPENRMYEQYFTKLMKEDVFYRQSVFPDLPMVTFPKEMSFMDFDELYTAPNYGFDNARDYYNKCSAKNLVPKIEIPCNILFAKDDPIIVIPNYDSVDLPHNVNIYITDKGGHMGYIGMPKRHGGVHWMDNVLLNWINDIINTI